MLGKDYMLAIIIVNYEGEYTHTYAHTHIHRQHPTHPNLDSPNLVLHSPAPGHMFAEEREERGRREEKGRRERGVSICLQV